MVAPQDSKARGTTVSSQLGRRIRIAVQLCQTRIFSVIVNMEVLVGTLSSNNRNMTTMGPTGLELGLGGSGSALQSLRGQWYQRAVFEWSLVPELNVKILELV